MGKLADLATRCLAWSVSEHYDIARQMTLEMNQDIAGAIGIPLSVRVGDPALGNDRWVPGRLADYTASIDAALTLIPKGWRWSMEYVDGYSASVNSGNGFDTLSVAGHPTSPALALCAAALRARDLVEGEGA